jgi:serine/threonine protein kinase
MNGHAGAWRVPGYTEIRELGAGATGRVVMARHDVDGTMVAIKYLTGELLTDVGFVARFRHEARLLRMLNTPHAARLYEYVETGAGAAIVMELIDGVALRALLRSEGPTGPEAALVVLKGALLGLAAAHEAGLVHRDFKPENIVIDAEGGSKLVDFGIAVRAGDGENPAGTPPYMAPEQWTGAPAGPATDVYAATVVFFECLTGTRPFRAQNIAALARQHQIVPPPIEEVPPPLQGLVERGMAKHPADRPPSAEAFLGELETVATGAYGEDWEERGRRRLSSLALLLLALFPRGEQTPGIETSLAQTDLGRRAPLRAVGTRVAVGIGCVTAIAVVTAVLLGTGDDAALKAGVSTPTLSAGSPDVLPPVDQSEPPTEAPTYEPPDPTDDAPTPTASPTASPTATSPGVPPPVTSPPAATPTPKPTPTKTLTAKPSPSPTKKPSPSDDPEPDPTLSGLPVQPPSTPTRTPTPTVTSSPTSTSTPTATATTRPTLTRTPSPDPSTDEPERPRLSASPEPDSTPEPVILLALGLVTSGAVPVTLAVKHRKAGRHRRSGGK